MVLKTSCRRNEEPMNTVVSVVIPTLNESRCLRSTLAPLQPLRESGHEVLVVDGGSDDQTRKLASKLADGVLDSRRGRALQMNTGARAARGTILLFLHADTLVSHEALRTLVEDFPGSRRAWGHFEVRLSGGQPMLRIVETMMNLRSRLSGIATGDHGIFVRREAFEEIGGFPEIPLMEDIAISRRLKRVSRPCCPRVRIVTSSRRWEANGIWKTILLMWRLRLAYALGADPADLARSYRTLRGDPPPTRAHKRGL
jgi:rSAM/selenodomain-associated transferase 2